MLDTYILGNEKKLNIARTLRDSALVVGGGVGVTLLAERFGLLFGNSASQQIIHEVHSDPIGSFLNIVIAGPFFEETVFRRLPSVAIDTFSPKRKGDAMWNVGLPATLLFAAMHNLIINPGHGIEFNTQYLPIPQFLGGLFMWNAMRKRGFGHSVAIHSLNNLAAMGLIMLGTNL